TVKVLPAPRATPCEKPGVTTNARTIDSATRRDTTKRRVFGLIFALHRMMRTKLVQKQRNTQPTATTLRGSLHKRTVDLLWSGEPYSGQASSVEPLLGACLRYASPSSS